MDRMHDAEQILIKCWAIIEQAHSLAALERNGKADSPQAQFFRDDIATMAETLARSLRNERQETTS